MVWFRHVLLLALVQLGLLAEVPAGRAFRQTHSDFRIHAHQTPFPSNLVSALVQDRAGRVWAGTVAGLARYDGRAWDPVDLPIPAHQVWVNNNAMGTLEDGTLWVGTRAEGLFFLREGTWVRVGQKDGLPSDLINVLLESRVKDSRGQRVLYVGTYGGGLARRVGGRWEVLDERHGLPAREVFALAEDEANRLWVGTRAGLVILEGDRFMPFPAQQQLPDPEVRQLLWTRNAEGRPELWIGGLRGGPCSWVDGRLHRHGVGSRGISHLIAARTGGVWVSFWGDGLARWDGRTWQTWGKEDGLPSGHLRCLLEVEEDGRSILWIGSDGRGVFRTAEGGWRQLQPRWPGEVEIRAFSEGPDGAFWMAGRNFGLFRENGRGWRRWGLPSRTVTGDVRCLAWFQGQLWAGCDLELLKLGPGGLELGAPGTLMDRKIIRCLLSDGSRLWVGSSTGLLSWDGRRAMRHPLPGGLAGNSIRSLALGPTGLWVGTDGGLFRPEPGGGHAPVGGLEPGDRVLSLQAAGDELWLGTSGGKVLRHRAGVLSPFAAVANRGSVQALLVNREGTLLYAGCSSGVETFDLRTGQKVDRSTQEDGLPGEECLPGALFEDSLGRIWVGTSNGAGALDPLGSRAKPRSKNLQVVGAWTAEGPRPPGFQLNRSESWLDVQFTLLAHHREQESRYRTQLLPVESAPGEWGPESHRRLQSLPRGSYVLRIWGRDFRGLESGPAEFPFRVVGRIWEHPASMVLGVLVLLGLGGLLVRARMTARTRHLEAVVAAATGQLVHQRDELEELARQQKEIMAVLAHDIRNPLSGIALTAEILEEDLDAPEAKDGLRRIRSAVASVTEQLQQFLSLQAMESGVVALKMDRVPVRPLLQDVSNTLAAHADRKGQCILLEGPDLQVQADGEVLREVLANLVSNALKFSPWQSKVVVRTRMPAPGLGRIEVEDQGPGIADQDRGKLFTRFAKLSARPTGGEPSIGLGLAICKRMVESMGGRIGVESTPGRGSTFWVDLATSGTEATD